MPMIFPSMTLITNENLSLKVHIFYDLDFFNEQNPGHWEWVLTIFSATIITEGISHQSETYYLIK